MAHARSRAEGPSNTHHSQQKKEGEKKAVKCSRENRGRERGKNTLLEKDNGTKLRHILSTSVPFNTSLESL